MKQLIAGALQSFLTLYQIDPLFRENWIYYQDHCRFYMDEVIYD